MSAGEVVMWMYTCVGRWRWCVGGGGDVDVCVGRWQVCGGGGECV